ncbi:hypothetical protein [Amycolatopsis solani]|uniref:hypothetical protein n=1 Tax=Amycolatopsis solani TaxID=3028615 RepID=UPI0025AF2D28|nr:hypothetical protein [Amycolatopsis sp. MEP2-6]
MDETHNRASGSGIGQFGTVYGNVTINAGLAPESSPPDVLSPVEAGRIAARLAPQLRLEGPDDFPSVYGELAALPPPDAAAVFRCLPHEYVGPLLRRMPVPLADRMLPLLGLDYLRELVDLGDLAPFSTGRLLSRIRTEDAVRLLRELPAEIAMDLLSWLHRAETRSPDAPEEHEACFMAAERIWTALVRP